MYAGIDAGSISFKLVIYDENEYIRKTVFHNGEPVTAFQEILNNFPLKPQDLIISGKYAGLLSHKYDVPIIDPVKSIVHNPKKGINYIIDIGSSKLCLIELKDGAFHRFNTNSLCASGTGAFLDQQMQRMGLNYGLINDLPFIEGPPSIATRCAVFAKSDLIHRQQQGHTVDALWNGLAKGMAESAFSTLFRGKHINGDIMLIGGLTNNHIFVEYLSRMVKPNELKIFEDASYYQAESNLKYKLKSPDYSDCKSFYAPKKETERPLIFERGEKISHHWELDEYQNEVDIFNLKKHSSVNAYIGIDIGSTSTKLVAVDKDGIILFGLYTRTRGKPIDAFRNLLKGIKRLIKDHDLDLRILGTGTTGSGRKLVGHFSGADIVVNEITAHLRGALKEYPDIKTIFEIGGQDSKYIFVEDGFMKDANMNYVCAAGTGSFIEEQANNLQIKLSDTEKLCHGVRPPVSSDRCTVFMEQDSTQLLINGFTKNEVMASMLYSVCKNYLNRVVHHRPIAGPVLFVGATAKNKGLVKAFENIIGQNILTSNYGHIMGALGITEILRKGPPRHTTFRGLDIYKTKVTLSESDCGLCLNKCKITNMEMEGHGPSVSWGYMCGKEPDSDKALKTPSLAYIEQMKAMQFPKTATRVTERKLYMPQALQYYSHFIFWQKFFEFLGITLLPSDMSNNTTAEISKAYSISDFCYPLKLTIGHIIDLYNKNKAPVFLPYHIQDISNPKTDKSHFCPFSQGLPSIIKNTLEYNNIKNVSLISPVIDFEHGSKSNSINLYNEIKTCFAINRKDIQSAFEKAFKHYISFINSRKRKGMEIIEKHRQNKKKEIVLMGRPYNIFDRVLNLDLLKSIGNYGYDIIPSELLPVSRKDIPNEYSDIYWAYGQHLVTSALFIKNEPGLYAVYLTNFSCGPDSFLLSIIEKIMGTKPFLVLELDELGGDAGYITRLEAFFDRIKNHSDKEQDPVANITKLNLARSINGHNVYIPPMHPIATKLMANAFKAFSINAVPMEREDMHTYNIGRSVVRGAECMPAASTIGSFLYYLRENGPNEKSPDLLFMPCTSGPCRFGQYARLHHNIINSNNLNAKVYSPSAEDNYGDLGGLLRVYLLKSIIISDLFTKIGCAFRPYEKKIGATDEFITKYTEILGKALENRQKMTPLLKQVKSDLLKIEYEQGVKKPLIGIVGEIYVRNSPFSNSYLIRNIEKFGGEAWPCSAMEWLHYTAFLDKVCNKGMANYLKAFLSEKMTEHFEKRYYGIFKDLLHSRMEPEIHCIIDTGRTYVPLEFTGETILTVGRGIKFIEQGVDMLVNVSPFTCMPGTISSAIFRNISRKYSLPVISMFYDGENDFNDLLETYISNLN